MVRSLQLLTLVLWLLHPGGALALTISEHVLAPVNLGENRLGSLVPVGEFLDVYTFSLATPVVATAAVVALPIDSDELPERELDAVLVSLGLYDSADRPLAIDTDTADGLGVVSVLPSGFYKLAVLGLSSGAVGGLYGGVLLLQAVPEPTPTMLMLAGLLLLASLRAKRHRG